MEVKKLFFEKSNKIFSDINPVQRASGLQNSFLAVVHQNTTKWSKSRGQFYANDKRFPRASVPNEKIYWDTNFEEYRPIELDTER